MHSEHVQRVKRILVSDHGLMVVHTYSQSHAARADDPPFQRTSTWLKANPLRSATICQTLKRRYQTLKLLTPRKTLSVLASFRALRLNQGTSDTTQSTLLDVATWARIEGDAPRQGQCVWGLDLGTSAAQSAVAAYWPDSGRLEVLAAFPREPSLGERGLERWSGGAVSALS